MKILFFVLVLNLAGCAQGTGTGNPFYPVFSSGPNAGSMDSIFTGVCNVVIRCHPTVTSTDCGNGIAPLTGFAAKLGILSTPPPTAEQILIMEVQGQITPQPTASTACEWKLNDLSCSDPSVMSAYDPTSSSPFAGTVNLLDPICTGVFAH